MSARVQSIIEVGAVGIVIDIECQLSNGLPNIIIVGYANKAVDEAKERVRGAFAHTKLTLPRKRITLNLAPADIPKEGTGFDLAMAAAILTASKQTTRQFGADELVVGELGLDGSVRPVRGLIGKLLAAREQNITTCYLPPKNLSQAMLVPGITVVVVPSLRDLYLDLNGTVPLKRIATGKGQADIPHTVQGQHMFQDVIGQKRAKRALEIAAAGAHNVLLSGAPGTGKSMLAKALPSILPPLNHEEILEVTHLHSLASKQYDHIISQRPFRTPHHSASDTSIIGGGQYPKPGEISLSHRGILFLDEFPEFSRPAIEALRQPLEDKHITIARARDSLTFPANFILIATANPCPCGYYGTPKPCSCLPSQIVNYQRKLSGPILDRIDMYVEVDEVAHAKLLGTDSAEESSEAVLQRVMAARQQQHNRYAVANMLNADLSNREIKRSAGLSDDAKALLDQAAERLGISARAYMRCVKVARTIADLEDSPTIERPHVTEALQYRRQTTSL